MSTGQDRAEPLIRKATPEERERARLSVRDFTFWEAGYEEGKAAALRSVSADSTAGLDVERLVEAMFESFEYIGDEPVLPFYDDHKAFWEPFAAKVAREYDRLGSPSTPTPEDPTDA